MPKAPDNMNAKDLHQILIRNLHGVDAGTVPHERAHAIARLGSTIFQGVNTRMKIRAATAGDSTIPQDLVDFAS